LRGTPVVARRHELPSRARGVSEARKLERREARFGVDQGVSHVEIGRAEFDRAVQLLQRAKAVEDRKLKSGWRPQ
jgi:hypothetical protein